MCETNTREIITLQVGNYANHVGTHFFNLQNPVYPHNSEVDPGTLWRQVLNPQRNPIWVPRVLIFDLKDNYCGQTLSQSQSQSQNRSSLENQNFASESTSLFPESAEEERRRLGGGSAESGVLWEGALQYVDLRESGERGNAPGSSVAGVSESKVKRIDSGDVTLTKTGSEGRSWVDYARWKLHWSHEKAGESRFSLPNFSHNPTSAVVSNYGQGLQIYMDMQDKITDGIRRLAEPCDYFQGFQIIADENDGFGGLASGMLEHISDEYEKKTSFCFGVSPPSPKSTAQNPSSFSQERYEDFKLRTLSTCLTWNSFALHSSVFTSIALTSDLFTANPQPVQLPFQNYNPQSAYESSSFLAAAVDTLTRPYTLKTPGIRLSDLVGLLNGYGHKMTMVGSAFPFALFPDCPTLFQVLEERGLEDVKSLTPGVSLDLTQAIGNFFVPRGFSDDQVIRRKEGEGGSGRCLVFGGGSNGRDVGGIRNAESCVEVYARETCRKSVNVVRSIATPFKLSHPFPVLFQPSVFPTLNKSPDPPTLASWATSTAPASTSGGGTGGGSYTWETPVIASAHNSLQVGHLLQKLIDVELNNKRNFVYSRSLLHMIPNVEADDYQECLDNMKVLRETYQVDSF